MSYPGDFLGNSKARKKSNTKKKSSRKSFTKFQQTETLANQDYKCNECKIPFKKSVHPHFDHIDGNNSNNALENCQALCANCHDNKSRHENVKRSIEKKDQNFVKCCPFCREKLKGKYYKSDNGSPITTDYMPANDFFPCRNCESIFKIIRQETKEGVKKLTGKKLKEVVQYCVCCSCEFERKVDSNSNLECAECHKIWGVWIKKYNKPSFWS